MISLKEQYGRKDIDNDTLREILTKLGEAEKIYKKAQENKEEK